jgi:threonine dehydratase
MTRSSAIRPGDWSVAIDEARERIAGLTLRTVLTDSVQLSRSAGVPVRFKGEFAQPSGSFKQRGAANMMVKALAAGPVAGFVTFSTGNHARAVVWVASRLGVPATVCLSHHVPSDKVAALRGLGGEVVIDGDSQDEAGEVARGLAAERGLVMVHPFDDPDVIAGQGTIGAELLQDAPDLAAVVVPLSGGGLISGIALAVKAARPAVRIIGVSPTGGAAMIDSIRAGAPVATPEVTTLADSLLGGIGLANDHTFAIVREHVDQFMQVDERAIAAAIAAALKWERFVLEGAAAIGIGAILQGLVLPGPTAVILTGRQIGLERLAEVARTQYHWLLAPETE